MKYEDLIKLCIQIIQTYNPITLTVDSHSEEFLQKHSKKLEDTESVFIKQIFYGTFRYEEFLKIFTNALFKDKPSQTNRQDQTLYQIFIYIICFRLNELPFHEFKKLVYSQEAIKMNVLLSFLFDFERLTQIVRPQWIEVYDIPYIDNQIIGQLEDRVPQMTEILGTLSERATGKKSELVQSLEKTYQGVETNENEVQDKKKKTVQKPFNLTAPKPKKIPEPIKIPLKVEVRPVPKNLNKTNLEQIEKEKRERRNSLKEKIEAKNQNEKQFEFQTLKRPNNLEKITKEVEEQREKQLKFDKVFYKPVPVQQEDAEVKLNIVAVLREENKIKEAQLKEEKRIKDLQWNMRDSTEFQNWKDEVQYKDKVELQEHLQRKKIEMELAREAAIKAFEEKVNENKQLVAEMRQISLLKEKEKEENKKEDLEKKQQLIETVLETRDNAIVEKQKILDKNKKIHDDNKKEWEIMYEKKLEEDEVERKKREQLIKEIYELDRQNKKKQLDFDENETMGYGLLAEMSLAELKTKLEQVKQEQKEKTEEIRQNIVQKKDEQLNSLQKKVQLIKDQRQNLQIQKQQEREDKKLKQEKEIKLKQDIKEKSLLEVHDKIENKKKAKKKEKTRLAKELREIQLKRQYMNANAAIAGEKAYISQNEGAQREIKDRQITKLVDQELIESVKYKDRKLLAQSAKQSVDSKVQFNKDYDQRLEKANKENEVLQRTLREYKQAIHEQQKEWETLQKQNTIERDPYKHAISTMHLTQAKEKLQKTIEKYSNERLDLPGQNYDQN